MKIYLRLPGVLLLFLALALIGFACSDDDPTDGGEIDNDPPAVTKVTGVNSSNVRVEFNEQVNKETAERPDNYLIIESAAAAESGGPVTRGAAPNDTIHVGTAVLLADGKQVLLSTWTWMTDVNYELTVKGIKDVNGNRMTAAATTSFTGSFAPDEIAPELMATSPAPNATNVGTGQSVIVQFSEPMNNSTVFAAFSWTHGTSHVPVKMEERGNVFLFTPLLSLQLNTTYSVALSGAAEDWAGNNLTATNWTFRTTSSPDVTRPTLVSSSPADGAVNVSTGSSIRLNFSETIDPSSFNENAIVVTPSPGDGTGYWSNGGKTLTFEPDAPLADDTQYYIVMPEGAVRDLAGNWLAGSHTIQFTTGSGFASGRCSGLVEGDPFSDNAADPEGAVVVAPNVSPFSDNDENIQIFGADFVAADGRYSIGRLPDRWYFPFVIMDSNGDGRLEPDLGDAVGAYGVDIRMMDTEYDSVQIIGGSTPTGIDIKLFDPMAIAGHVAYVGGSLSQEQLLTIWYSVGFFDTTGFNLTGNLPDPDFGIDNLSVVFDTDWRISELESYPPLVAGTYYVGAYMEVDGNPGYDPDTEPAGFHMNYATQELIPVTVQNGSDALGIDIYLADPASGPTLPAVGWTAAGNVNVPDEVIRTRRLQSWMQRAIDARRSGR